MTPEPTSTDEPSPPALAEGALCEAPSESRRDWLWRRSDQLAIGGLVALALIAMAAWWWWRGGTRGELIEFQHAPTTTFSFQVDVNSADWPELAQLPGIGERTARRIVEWRRQHGPFRRQADLLLVDGIGQVTLDGFRQYLGDLPP